MWSHPERLLEPLRVTLIRPLVGVLPQAVTPNVLSWMRLGGAAVLAWLLSHRFFSAAVVLYILALLTDALDGEVARVRRQTSPFGARLDPAADKILHAVLFVAFFPQAPLLFGSLLAVDGALFLAGMFLLLARSSRPVDFSASVFGKWKMIAQAMVLLGFFANLLTQRNVVPLLALQVLCVAALVLAVTSLLTYCIRLTTEPPFTS